VEKRIACPPKDTPLGQIMYYLRPAEVKGVLARDGAKKQGNTSCGDQLFIKLIK
jgi:hypothetical protein